MRLTKNPKDKQNLYLVGSDGPDLTEFKQRRAQVNDELAEADMGLDQAVEHPAYVPRVTHQGSRWLIGLVTGCAIVEGLLLIWCLH